MLKRLELKTIVLPRDDTIAYDQVQWVQGVRKMLPDIYNHRILKSFFM